MNNVNLIGRLTADADIKTLASGAFACKMSVAFDTLKKDEYGNWTKESNFVTAKYFTKLDWQVEHLKKGQLVVISGKLKQESWETESGKRSQIIVMVDEIEPVNKIIKDSGNDNPFVEKPKKEPDKKTSSSDDVPF